MKEHAVIWSQKAIDSLQIIYNFVYSNLPKGAHKIVTELVNLSLTLETFPFRFPIGA